MSEEANLNPLILFAADSPAPTSAKPESEPGSPMRTVRQLARVFGLSSPVLLAKFDPDTFLSRTCQASLFQEQCPEFSETYPDSGMWDAGSVYELQTSERTTSGNEFSLWPTAQTFDQNDCDRTAEALARAKEKGGCSNLREEVQTWRTPDAPGSGGPRNRQGSMNAGHQVTIAEQAEHWRTPNTRDHHAQGPRMDAKQRQITVCDQAESWNTSPQVPQILAGQPSSAKDQTSRRHWPTPNTLDPMEPRDPAEFEAWNNARDGRTNRKAAANLRQAVITESNTKRRLNPRFVEWLMGFPIGWTELWETEPSGSGGSATPSSRKSPSGSEGES